MADCIACGAATPNPLGAASSQHHGRRRQRSVLSESLVGASNWGGSADVTKKRYFYTRQSTGLRRIVSPVALQPLIHFVSLRSNTVGEAPQHRFCRNRHRQHAGEGGGEGGGGGRGYVELVGRRRRVYMMKRSRAEALPIFYWARQLMPARTIKWRVDWRGR